MIEIVRRRDVALLPVSSRLKNVSLMHPNREALLGKILFSPDGGQILAGDYPGGVIQLWDAGTGEQLSRFDKGRGYLATDDYFFASHDWKRVYSYTGKQTDRWTYTGRALAWDLATGELVKTYQHDPPRDVHRIALSPDGKLLIAHETLPGVLADARVTLWDVRAGTHIALPEGLRPPYTFSPDGGTIAVTRPGPGLTNEAIVLLDTRTREEHLTISAGGKNLSVSVRDFSPSGEVLAGIVRLTPDPDEPRKWNSTLKLWDAATGAELAAFPFPEPSAAYIYPRFSAGGEWLVAPSWKAEKARIVIFDVGKRRVAHSIELGGKTTIVREPALSPDGKWAAVISQEIFAVGGELDYRDLPQPRIRLIELATGQVRETIVAPQGIAVTSTFSPDGKTLASGGAGRVLLWDVSDLTD